MNNTTYLEQIDQAVAYIKTKIQQNPTVGIVLGSGIGALADEIEEAIAIPYKEIPHFPVSTVAGHKGNLFFGRLGGQNVMAMQGRFHYYEGYTMREVTFPIRVMARLGVKTLFVSNAAGAVNPSYRVGDLMIITDHINTMPNPLIGPNMEEFGVRFPDMTMPYSSRLRRRAQSLADQRGLMLQPGVDVGTTGPSFETRSEYRYFATIGADAVGMSTVPEVIVARHSGIEVFGMSIITNQSNSLGEDCLNDGNDVIQAAQRATLTLTSLFKDLIASL